MFSISSCPEVIFGVGSIQMLPSKIKKFGDTILLCTGNSFFLNSPTCTKINDLLDKNKIAFRHVTIKAEPSSTEIDTLCNSLHDEHYDVVVAIGGGSVLDAGKAISAMLYKQDSVINYLEDVGTKIHDGTKIPFIAMPTTAGTGSEMTKNAVICDRVFGYKKSLRHDNFIPNVAIIDPSFLIDCPAEIIANSGLDALSQLIESYTSTKASYYTDALAFDAILRNISALQMVFNGNKSVNLIENLAYSAMVSGVTLANAGLGLVHGFATSLGGMFDIPHGLVCGTLIGETNKRMLDFALQNNCTELISKYEKLGLLVNASCKSAPAVLFIEKIQELVSNLRIQKLGRYGVSEASIEKILTQTGHKNNPVILPQSVLGEILLSRL